MTERRGYADRYLEKVVEGEEIDEYRIVRDEEEAFKGELRQSYEDAMNDGAADEISDAEALRRLMEVDNGE